MRQPTKAFAALALASLLAACASTPPRQGHFGLKLSPASFATSVSLTQHLKVEKGSRTDELDAVLEIDPGQLRMAGLVLGQRVLSLAYDGKKLESWRHLMLPREVQAEDVLDDLQLTLWPAEAVSQSLPAGWQLKESAGVRELFGVEGRSLVTIRYSDAVRWAGTVVLENHQYGYRLTIQNAQ